MSSFISESIDKLLSEHTDLQDVVLVVPNQRASVFIKNELVNKIPTASFLPKMCSIEEFVEDISRLKIADNTTILFDLYQVYKEEFKEIEPFDQFINWASMVISDFNDLDYYLVDTQDFFRLMSETERIERWDPTEFERNNITNLFKEEMLFWDKAKKLYTAFHKKFQNKAYHYKGYTFRKAVSMAKQYAENTDKHIVFLGFNALNKAEDQIFSACLLENKATIFWDVDTYYYNNEKHEAGKFLRYYLNKDHYRKNIVLKDHFKEAKKIEVFGTPKSVSQVKLVGKQLEKWLSEGERLSDTAVVLASEDILIPLLNSLPEGIDKANVTMGYNLGNIPIHSFFQILINLYANYEKLGKNAYYYEPLLSLLQNDYYKLLEPNCANLVKDINRYNKIFISDKWLIEKSENKEINKLIFNQGNLNANQLLENFIVLIAKLKEILSDDFDQEYLFKFSQIFTRLKLKLVQNDLKINIKSLNQFYKQMSQKESLSFLGEARTGMQIMGILETRLLNFKNLIITGVNEGVIPQGKQDNSFIPFDIRMHYKLPTYIESDSIYAYHFYRLLQRAENVCLIYDTDTDAMGSGEKSRFIEQMKLESPHEIKEELILSKPSLNQKESINIPKNKSIIEKLDILANSGFSPSALSVYIKDPMLYYQKYILGINEQDEVDELINYKTQGTIVHRALEKLYQPYINKILKLEDCKILTPKINNACKKAFQEVLQIKEVNGKNKITLAVIQQFVRNLLTIDFNLVKEKKELIILSLEEKVKIPLEIPELNKTVFLKGDVDRIDQLDGEIRIIDYKTGKVEPRELKIKDFEDILKETKKYPFQVLIYALMHYSKFKHRDIGAYIFSFKNIKSSYMPFEYKKDKKVNLEVLEEFKVNLRNLIIEMYDLNKAFEPIEK